MKIIAIVHKSCGNETVGDMWKETKIFNPTTPVCKVIEWAMGSNDRLRNQLELTLGEEEEPTS